MVVLAADDDIDDIEILSECLYSVNPSLSLSTAKNGKEALNYLEKADPLPDLIFLDMNMPVMDGKECLNAIRAIETYDNIHVVVFSTAIDMSDPLLRAYSKVRYMEKPYHVESYVSQITALFNELKK